MDLLELATRNRASSLAAIDKQRQSEFAQFFTPPKVAEIMASLVDLSHVGEVRILDPGAGSGMLTAALVRRIRCELPATRISITAVEADPNLHSSLQETLSACHAQGASTKIVTADFIDWALNTDERFDIVIQNPPYFKIRSGSAQDRLLKMAGIDVPNIYAAFMALGSILLRDNGQQVSITPRSWMNGTYFSRFRMKLLSTMSIAAIHTFESRSKVFDDLKVLQESIVVCMRKTAAQKSIALSSSVSAMDTPLIRSVPYGEVVSSDFIFVPSTQADASIVKWMESFQHTLSSLGLSVSTGRVVAFREQESLLVEPESDSAPLIYPGNISNNEVVHPASTVKKSQWIQQNALTSRRLLVPAGIYVLVKRFSAKEERRRLVASVCSSDTKIGFDNKLNYIHSDGHGLPPYLARGLSIWLNSEPVDQYFRIFSGHTQVNAGDMRQLPFPDLETLLDLGKHPGTDTEAFHVFFRSEESAA